MNSRASSLTDALAKLGRNVAEMRAKKSLTQEKLAEETNLPRTAIALLEQGARLPTPEQISSLGSFLGLNEQDWVPAAAIGFTKAMEFQDSLGELVGRQVRLGELEVQSQLLGIEAITVLLTRGMSLEQAFHQFNSVLTFFGERPVKRPFFVRFLGNAAFAEVATFRAKVAEFQVVALRLFGNFRQAYIQLRDASDLERELQPLRPVEEETFTGRRPFDTIALIPTERLDDLGYISAERVRRETKERDELSRGLREFAASLRSAGARGATLPQKRLTRLQSLMRKLEVRAELVETLYSSPDPEILDAAATALVPEENELARIEETQRMGLRNLAAYLTEPFMDVYVATSMRERADFVSVNSFVNELFADPEVSHLHLRFFNPTQSWVSDRVAKGLVEALMLKRSLCTVYMAQKGDTFGKDSEASVALGQGKPVIVYVPKLVMQEFGIDSEQLASLSLEEQTQQCASLDLEVEEGSDSATLGAAILRRQIELLSRVDFARLVRIHWADFDLLGEVERLPHDARSDVRTFIEALSQASAPDEAPVLSDPARVALTERIVAVANLFERRAKTFREVHPLALQVILSSGVLNGILVVRSTNACARALHRALTNTVKVELRVDEENYKLIDRETRSTLRVISRNALLTNAFWTQYFG